MQRRRFLCSLPLVSTAAGSQPSKYAPDWDSLKTHPVPAWYEDAKLGIFIHWGLYSVPAWAPPTGELGKVDWNTWFYKNPYAEWYLNTIRLKDSESFKHHAATYGADFDYYRFAETFNRAVAKWDPKEWAKLFRDSGAKYAVLTTKHHDGFTLWPSKVKNPKRPQSLSVKRDLTGELTRAVRAAGLKMGLYYSGGLDWTFETTPVAKLADLKTTAPQSQEYADYADAHWRELIDRYQPSILWNDITYPKTAKLKEIFADFYNRTPDGLVNNRFGAPHTDITTPEYTQYAEIVPKKWETCRGLGFSFGYNQVEDGRHVIATDKLIEMLIDITAKNGNLLLNIGPKADGSISAIQMDRLTRLGAWMKTHGEGIHGTRPRMEASAKASAKAPSGEEIRFTRKGELLYAFVYTRPKGTELVIPAVTARPGSAIHLLGGGAPLTWRQQGPDLAVTLPASIPGEYAFGLKITA
jgi:alpha-L-fucosidase